jgi:hypothetical protein
MAQHVEISHEIEDGQAVRIWTTWYEDIGVQKASMVVTGPEDKSRMWQWSLDGRTACCSFCRAYRNHSTDMHDRSL